MKLVAHGLDLLAAPLAHERVARIRAHRPWPLQHAETDIDVNTTAAEIAVELRGEPLLHYARRQDVVFWTLRPTADDSPLAAQTPGSGERSPADASGRG